MSTKAIETRYGGHLFRSRLEARWAAYFDLVGWTWTYEPIDAGHYDGDHYMRTLGTPEVASLWGQAHEATRWMPRP